MPSPPGPPIPLGNPMKWEVTFLDVNSAPFDPASGIQISIENPNGGTTIYAYPANLTKEGVGIYSVEIEATLRGSWLGIGSGNLPDGKAVTTAKIEQVVI